ncbi:MAG TPA: right-handed parallel beta-helix repeat-containing protein [Kofleriaceae bacterium]
MRALIVITLLAACSKPNPNYCPGNPDDNCTLDADINAPQGCATAADCTNAAMPVCEPTEMICVACTADMAGACSGMTPVCTAANTCSACVTHDQCASQACLPTGACGDDTNVAYVAASGGDTGDCTRNAPCLKITNAALKGKPYIKVMTDLDEGVVLNSANVTILADKSTSVRRTTTGAIFEIRGTSNVTIRGLTIREGLGTTGHGIMVPFGEPVNLTLDGINVIGNSGTGVIVQGGTLAVSRSVVSGNSGGGAYVNATFNITNSLFVANGSGVSTTGGLFLTPMGNVTFKFNTVANNQATTGAIRGINCTLAVTSTNTIVSGNDVSSGCSFEYSLFDTGTIGGTNRIGDPKFKNVMPSNPLAANYFRIQSTSAAVDNADPASMMLTDIDGDARGNAPDIGADELN